jgi:hypothetical protein
VNITSFGFVLLVKNKKLAVVPAKKWSLRRAIRRMTLELRARVELHNFERTESVKKAVPTRNEMQSSQIETKYLEF